MKTIPMLLATIALNLAAAPVWCADADDMADMQRKLNAEVMSKPFSVEDEAKIDAYVQDAMKKDIKPRARPPAGWRSGYTCSDLHAYNDYRDCMYYHRYYGRYW